MSSEAIPWPVADEEQLARFVLFSRYIRPSDQTVRPEAFIPHPWPELSVTRHLGLAEAELWELGQAVANLRAVTLYGRADVRASTVRRQSLRIEPTPEPRNHANITGWPANKPAQKIIALEIAAASKYVPNPPGTPEDETH
jgi:hypothetical protein